jgi:hypothetical protein
MLPEGYAALLDAVLPRMEEHWCGTVTAWGSYDTDLVEVAREDHCIEWFLVRIDLREAHSRFLSVVCDISSLSDCYLLTEDRQLIPPQGEALLVVLKWSNAYLCVTFAQEWLNRTETCLCSIEARRGERMAKGKASEPGVRCLQT